MEYLEYIIYGLIPIVVTIALVLMNKSAVKAERNMDENHFVVRQPKFMMWLGIVIMLGISLAAAIIPTTEWWEYLIIIIFFLLGAFLAFYCASWKLEVIQNEVIFSAPMKKSETFTLDEIKRVRIKLQNTQNERATIFSETKKLLSVEPNCPGYNVLIAHLKQAGIKFEA